MSRVLLALLSVSIESGAEGDGNLIVFDEIDSGLGGRTARSVGYRLRALAARRQVLCITHLPQVAAGAETHFRIAKNSAGDGSVTSVDRLEGTHVEAELVRMLGADEMDAEAIAHARKLLSEA